MTRKEAVGLVVSVSAMLLLVFCMAWAYHDLELREARMYAKGYYSIYQAYRAALNEAGYPLTPERVPTPSWRGWNGGEW